MNAACRTALVLALLAGGAAAAPLRDPFSRPAAPAPAPAAVDAEALPVLRAIMFGPGKSLANVGGHILTVGEWYGPYRVVRIDERSVTLLRGKARRVLALDEENGK